MTRDIKVGDLVEFGPEERPLMGEVRTVSDGGVVVVAADFLGRCVAFSITDPATIRRVPATRRPHLVRFVS